MKGDRGLRSDTVDKLAEYFCLEVSITKNTPFREKIETKETGSTNAPGYI